MIRHRLGTLLALLMIFGSQILARQVFAAAEVHRLNFVVSAIPTEVSPSDFNDLVGQYNAIVLRPRGIDGIKKITYGWLFDVEMRYFVRQNVAVSAGVGQFRKQSRREVLPALQQDIQLRAELLSVPIHVGADYYLQAYNQGDFQARAYIGAGFLSSVYNFGRLQATEAGTDSATTVGGTYEVSIRGDGPGYYVETGVHMFFAARYSVLIGLLARSSKARETIVRFRDSSENLVLGRGPSIDTSGVGALMALAIGF